MTKSLLLGLTIGLLILANYLRYYYTLTHAVGASVLITCGIAAYVAASGGDLRDSLKHARTSLRVVLLCCAVRWLLQMVDFGLGGQSRTGIGLIIIEAASLTGAFLTMARRTQEEDRPIIITIGLACYCGANLLAYGLGMLGTHGESTGTIASMSGGTDRMIAPFSAGLNTFGVIAGLGGVVAFASLYNALRARALLSAGAAVTSLLICLYSAYRTQTRSALLLLCVAIAWICLPHFRIRVGLMCCVIAASVLAPIALPPLLGSQAFAELSRSILPENLERYPAELSELGGRTAIWRYGMDQILAGSIPLLGQGLSIRDASPALLQEYGYRPGLTMSYHNGSLDAFVVFGPIAWTALAIGILFVVLQAISRDARAKTTRVGPQLALLILTATAGASAFESFTNEPFFWMLVLVAVLGLEGGFRPANCCVRRTRCSDRHATSTVLAPVSP